MLGEGIALLVEGDILGSSKQRVDIDLEKCDDDFDVFFDQLGTQLYHPDTEQLIPLPHTLSVMFYDLLTRKYMPLTTLSSLKDRMKIKLVSSATATNGTADADSEQGEPVDPSQLPVLKEEILQGKPATTTVEDTKAKEENEELVLELVSLVVAQLASFAYDDVPLSDVAMDNLIHTCKQRHQHVAMGVDEERFFRRVRAALIAAYEVGKEKQRPLPFSEELERLRSKEAELTALTEKQAKRIAELEEQQTMANGYSIGTPKNGQVGATTSQTASAEFVLSPKTNASLQQLSQQQQLQGVGTTPIRPSSAMGGTTPMMPPQPPPSPAIGGGGSSFAYSSAAQNLTPLMQSLQENKDPDRSYDEDPGLRTPPNTPQVSAYGYGAPVPPLSPVQMPESLVNQEPTSASTRTNPPSNSSSKPPTPPPHKLSPTGVSTPPPAPEAKAVNPPYTISAPAHADVTPMAASEPQETHMISVFYNAYDPVRRLTTKRGRAIALGGGMRTNSYLVQLQRAVCRAFNRPVLDIGYVHYDGQTRVIIDTNEALEVYLNGHEHRGSKPVLQCFDPEEPEEEEPIRNPYAINGSPNANAPSPPSRPPSAMMSRPTSAMRQSRPTSALASRPNSVLSVNSTMSLPFDTSTGSVLDDDELQFQFGLVSKDGKTAHKMDVLNYLQSRYDDMGDSSRFQRILDKFKRPQLVADEFAIILLKLSAS